MRTRRASGRRRYASVAVIIGALASPGSVSVAQEVTFPPDAGVIDVTRPPYNAKGDGTTDDTDAIQAALADHPDEGTIIFLPARTFVVSGTLRWPHGSAEGTEEKNTILQGESRDRTILKLKDGCTGFDNPERAKAVIWTGEKPAQRFRNAVRNLTIDVGKDNPGAIGLQFIANNQGCVRDVTVRSADGKGRIGLDLSYTEEIGPCLIKNVLIFGFDYGVRTAHASGSVTFENLTLEQQETYGFVNEGQSVSIRGLTSRNGVTVMHNAGDLGHLVLLDATLVGTKGAQGRAAVYNEASMYARNVSATGYREAIRNAANGRKPEGKEAKRKVDEFVSHPVESLFPAPPKALSLPVKETPDVPWDDHAQWVSPTHFGAQPGDNVDDTGAIQKAIDSGKTTVYLPRGYYLISDTVLIRKNVRRIIGCEATIGMHDLDDKPVFKLVDGAEPVVVFERIQAGYLRVPILENASTRTLVVRDCFNVCGNMTGPGDVFLEDVSSNPFTSWRFGEGNVWARQLDVENEGTHIVNGGGQLWILGLKTGRGGTLVETTGGGRTEVLGGLCNSTGAPKAAPMFVSRDSWVSVTFAETNSDGNAFATLLSESRGGTTKMLKKGDVPRRTGGSVIPLFVGQAADR